MLIANRTGKDTAYLRKSNFIPCEENDLDKRSETVQKIGLSKSGLSQFLHQGLIFKNGRETVEDEP